MSFWSHAGPVAFTLFLWWFSTGAILYLDSLPMRTFRWSLGAMSVVAACALHALHVTSSDTSELGAYIAFTCTILLWGWVEMALLMGFITGPRTTACPPGASGSQRAWYAFQTIAWHEVALLVAGGLVAAATWGAPNQLGVDTFVVLWVSRQSTKLNLFLGVRNLSEEFLPVHLRYLESYFVRRPMNLLFPLSVTACSWAAALCWNSALGDGNSAAAAAGPTFLASLLTLALIEHWFLVAPIRFAALWDWSLDRRRSHSTSPVDREGESKRIGTRGMPAIDPPEALAKEELCPTRR